MRYLELMDEVDLEWVQLIQEALEIGITKEEIIDFLNSAGDS